MSAQDSEETWSQGAWVMLKLDRPVTLSFRMMLTSAARAKARRSTDTSTLLIFRLTRFVGQRPFRFDLDFARATGRLLYEFLGRLGNAGRKPFGLLSLGLPLVHERVTGSDFFGEAQPAASSTLRVPTMATYRKKCNLLIASPSYSLS